MQPFRPNQTTASTAAPLGGRAQATVEYVLVLLGAAAIALLLLAAIVKSDKVGQLLNAVFDSIVGKVV